MKEPEYQTPQIPIIRPQSTIKKSPTAEKMIVAKIIMLGDVAVGKTSLVKRYVHRDFKGSYKATLGLDLSFRDISVPGKATVRLQLWDLSGQTQFKIMRKRFYTGTSAAVIVFDVTRPYTFQNLNFWLSELKENVGHVMYGVVGNKVDLYTMIASEEEEERQWAKNNKAVVYMRTSAKSGINVDRLFEFLANNILEKLEQTTKLKHKL